MCIDGATGGMKLERGVSPRAPRTPFEGGAQAGIGARTHYTEATGTWANPAAGPFEREQKMTSGAEAFKAAIRRSALLVLFLIILGAVALVTLRQLQGARYEASARILIENQNLAEALTGTQPSFVDPQRIEQTARALADSPELYARAAKLTGRRLGSGSDLHSATAISGGDNNLLTFTASDDHPQDAIAIADAVARSYIGWRSDVLGRAARQAIDQIRVKLQTGRTPANAADLRKQLDTLELMQTLNSDATLVDRATSAAKTRPTPIRDGLLGASIGLVIALLLVAAREAIDTTVRSEADVEDILGAPVLATVRSLPRRARMVTYGRHETAFGDTYALLAATISQTATEDQPRILAITSAVSSEGKTTTAANLAVALARRGHRVILADFDFRKPALAKLFELPKSALGVLQVLADSATVTEVAWQVVLEGRSPLTSRVDGTVTNNDVPVASRRDASADGAGGRLWILPAGGTLRSQAALRMARVPDVLQELRSHADFVLLDTPPALLAVEMSELAGLIDSVLVVVRNGRVTHRSLRLLNRQARTWNADLAGAVVTDAAGEEQNSYYGGR
jgi:tyrosine-protein kinase